jgi:uncharacterized membrane protein
LNERRLRIAIGVLALAGIAIAAYIEYERASGGQLACGTGGCEQVQNSKYAELFGVPVAVLGLAAYAVVFTTALLRLPAAALTGAAVALAGLAFALYLLAVQAFVLDAYCTWCLASDAVLAALAIVTTIRAARV